MAFKGGGFVGPRERDVGQTRGRHNGCPLLGDVVLHTTLPCFPFGGIRNSEGLAAKRKSSELVTSMISK